MKIVRVCNIPVRACVYGDVEIPDDTPDDKMQDAINHAIHEGAWTRSRVEAFRSDELEPDWLALDAAAWDFDWEPAK